MKLYGVVVMSINATRACAGVLLALTIAALVGVATPTPTHLESAPLYTPWAPPDPQRCAKEFIVLMVNKPGVPVPVCDIFGEVRPHQNCVHVGCGALGRAVRMRACVPADQVAHTLTWGLRGLGLSATLLCCDLLRSDGCTGDATTYDPRGKQVRRWGGGACIC